MSNEPRTWHYGLVARWWDEFNAAGPEELACFRAFVERDGQPALDLACGTGRLLLPLLREGFDVDGCDISPDMLARCQTRAAATGSHPGCTPRPCTRWTCHARTAPSSSAAVSVSGARARKTRRRCGAAMPNSPPAAPWCSTTTSPMSMPTSGPTGWRSRGRSFPRPGQRGRCGSERLMATRSSCARDW